MAPSIFSTMIAAAALAGAFVLGREIARKRLAPTSFAARVLAPTAIAAFAGAKLAGFLDAYVTRGDDAWPYLLQTSGHSFYGLFLFGTLALLVQAWRARIPLAPFLDALAPALMLGYAIGRIGCHLAGDGCYGVPSDLSWAAAYPDGLVPTLERVHPTPLYESVAAAVFFALLWSLRRRSLPPGTLFALCLALYGLERFSVEFLRLNPRYGPFSQAQWISLLAILAGGLALAARWPPGRRKGAAQLAVSLLMLVFIGGCSRETLVHELQAGRSVRMAQDGFELEAEEIHVRDRTMRVSELWVRPRDGAATLRGVTLAAFLDLDQDRRHDPPEDVGMTHEPELEDGAVHLDEWSMEVDGPRGDPTFLITIRTVALDHVLRVIE